MQTAGMVLEEIDAVFGKEVAGHLSDEPESGFDDKKDVVTLAAVTPVEDSAAVKSA